MFRSIHRMAFQDLPCFVFVSSSDAIFGFTFAYTAKLKKINFLNDFFLSLLAFARVKSFFTLSSKSV